MSQKVRVGIIGAGKSGASIYKSLKASENAEVVMVCDILDVATGVIFARQDGVRVCSSIETFCQQDLDIIIDATGQPEVEHQIRQYKSIHTAVIEANAAKLMIQLLEEKSKESAELIPLDILEKRMIRLALQQYGNSVEGKKKAAQSLNISLATLYNKIKTM